MIRVTISRAARPERACEASGLWVLPADDAQVDAREVEHCKQSVKLRDE